MAIHVLAQAGGDGSEEPPMPWDATQPAVKETMRDELTKTRRIILRTKEATQPAVKETMRDETTKTRRIILRTKEATQQSRKRDTAR